MSTVTLCDREVNCATDIDFIVTKDCQTQTNESNEAKYEGKYIQQLLNSLNLTIDILKNELEEKNFIINKLMEGTRVEVSSRSESIIATPFINTPINLSLNANDIETQNNKTAK